jgi:signal transduction histidine kinase
MKLGHSLSADRTSCPKHLICQQLLPAIPGRRFPRVALTGLLAVLLFLSAAPSDAQPGVRQVLVLQSFERGNMIIDHFTTNFRVELDKQVGRPVNVLQVVVGPEGFVAAPEQATLDFIRSLYTGRPDPDLIMAVAGVASAFARRHRAQLFPDAPLFFAAVDQRFLGSEPLGENETATAASNDFPRIVDEILQLLPQTTQLFVVTGSGVLAQFWRRVLDEELKRFRGRLELVWLDKLSFEQLLRRCASLPRNAAIFYVAFGTDAAGGAYADERVLADLHATANAPVFVSQSAYLGAGAVGGSLMSNDEMIRTSANAAARLLNGAAPRSVKVPLQLAGQPVFDWRELQRWGIPESRLPAGSVVRYRAPSLWSAYRGTMLSAVGVLAVQSLLIVGLLYQRRARQRAESDSRRNLALATDASRRQTMAALTNSIAHELGQPLSSMIHNAHSGRMMITGNRATPDTIREILSDIESQGVQATEIIHRHLAMLRNHPLEKKPIDLHAVIHGGLALVAHDMSARQIEATVNLSSSPCTITGDQVLLQQVLVNLVMNAMDAMAETPPARRCVAIRTEVRAADVELSVSDTGTGLPGHVEGKLFTPFVTTKALGTGIGLTIARTIVDAHHGTIDAHNNPEGGATFTVTLPRSETPENLSGPRSAA